MKVFVFCVAILLATAVSASPIDVEDTEVVNNEVVDEPESDAIIVDNDEQVSQGDAEAEEPAAFNEPEAEVVENDDEMPEKVDEAEEPAAFSEQEPEAEVVENDDEMPENVVEVEEPAALYDQEPEAIMVDNDKQFSLKVDEPEENAAVDEVVEEETNVINESEDEVAPLQNEKDEEPVQEEFLHRDEKGQVVSQERWERIAGLEIPLCAQHKDERHPLHLSHPTDCSKFYMCSRGRAFLMDCPSDEHWSVKSDRCDYEHLAKCRPDGTYQFKVKKAKPFRASAQEEEDLDQPELGEFEVDPRCEGSDPFKPLQLRHPTDCTKFYKCYMGKAYVIKCPKGQQWGQALNRCDHPQIARCSIVRPAIKPAQAFEDSEEDDEDEYYDEHTIVDDPDYEVEDPRCEPDEVDMFHPIHFAHPTDCTMYYRCYEHKGYKSQCPIGLYFNEEREYCDYPHNVDCKADAHPYEASVMQAAAPEIPDCPAQGDQEVNFAVEGINNRYFSCINGVAYLKECQTEELFNPLSKRCERFTRPQQQRPQYPNSGLAPTFPGTWEQFFAMMNQYPGMMNQYPSMNAPMIPMSPQVPMSPQTPNVVVPQVPNTRPQLVPQTPEFPSWMPVPNQNVPMPEMPLLPVNPSDDNKNSFNYEKGKVNSRCPAEDDPSKPAHLSHETDCNKFYKCYNGRAFELECPMMQEFSDELQRCDFHQFAKCDPIELIKKKIQI